MTPSQKKAVERIRKKAEADLFFGGPEKYEFKKWEVEDFGSFVSVVLETGIKGDEGTLAEALCRDRAHLFIRRRGGVTYPVYTRQHGSVERRWDGVTLLTPVIDQRSVADRNARGTHKRRVEKGLERSTDKFPVAFSRESD